MPAPAFSVATRKIARGRARDARPPGANPTESRKGPSFHKAFLYSGICPLQTFAKLTPVFRSILLGHLLAPLLGHLLGQVEHVGLISLASVPVVPEVLVWANAFHSKHLKLGRYLHHLFAIQLRKLYVQWFRTIIVGTAPHRFLQ